MQLHARSITLLSFILVAQQTFASPLPCDDTPGCEVARSGIREGDLDRIPTHEGYALRAIECARAEQYNALCEFDDLDDIEDWADYAAKRGLLRWDDDDDDETEGSVSEAGTHETNAYEDARRRRALARAVKPLTSLSNFDLEGIDSGIDRRHDDGGSDTDAGTDSTTDSGASCDTEARNGARRALSRVDSAASSFWHPHAKGISSYLGHHDDDEHTDVDSAAGTDETGARDGARRALSVRGRPHKRALRRGVLAGTENPDLNPAAAVDKNIEQDSARGLAQINAPAQSVKHVTVKAGRRRRPVKASARGHVDLD